MGSQNHRKVPLDVHVDALLQEASQHMQESPGLKLEWDHYCKLEGLISKIQEKEAYKDGTDLNLNNGQQQRHSNPSESEGQAQGQGGDPDGPKHLMIKDTQQRKESFPTFVEWLRQNDINPDKVEISYKDPIQGFGLTTKVPLAAGDVVFTIPQKAIITSAIARESKLKILVDKDPLLSTMQNVLLAIYLIYERFANPNSQWKPYIDILPRIFDTVVYFNKEEMTVLKHSPTAFREALRMFRNVARQYAYFHTKFRKATDSASRALKPVFTYNRYIWGVSAVTTRINHLPNPLGEPILSLIPLWDICNHEENEIICTDYNEEQQTLICYASHDYDKKTEFYIFYGKRSSVDYLVHNGFVPQNYRHDSYSLELGVGTNDLNYNRKKSILGKLGLECQNSFSVKPDRLATATKLFAFIRVFQADEAALSKMESQVDDLSFLEEATDACWKYLAMRFSLLKAAAENSLASTMKTLYGENSTNLPRVTLILLQLLKNEQKVLEMLAHVADSQLVSCTLKTAIDINTNSSTPPADDSQ